MKKRYLSIIIVLSILVLNNNIIADIGGREVVYTKGIGETQTTITEGTSPEGNQFKQYSPVSEATTNSGAKFKSSNPLGGLLKTFINGIILAESFTDLLIPDSIQIINPTFITYNTIENYIIIDSAEAIKLLQPFEMQLNNLGKTKIQLNSQNEVQNIQAQFKSDQEQTFN